MPVAPPPDRTPEPAPKVVQSRPPMPAAVVVGFTAVFALTAVLVFLAVYAVGFSTLQEQRSQHQLYASLRGVFSPASPVAPKVGGIISPGTPIAVVNAPEGGLHDAVVVEGTSSSDLLAGPGHLRDSALPGQAGQSMILGKSVTAGAPFRHVTSLRRGDLITVTTGQGTFHFTVDGERAGGDPLPAIPSGGALLTLVTSTGSGLFGHIAPSHIVYVDATLHGKPAAAPPGRPVAVPAAELPGRSDPGAWPFIVLWLQALVVVAAASVWAWIRWGRWQTWLVGAPVLLGVLWGLAQESMRLLPNVM
jgi:sortase A